MTPASAWPQPPPCAARAVPDKPPWNALRAELKGVSDVERITARTALRQVRPRELVALCKTLQKAELLAQNGQAPDPYLAQIFSHLQPPTGCMELLRRANRTRSLPRWSATAA